MNEPDRLAELAQRTAARGLTTYTRFLDLNDQKNARIAAAKAGIACCLFGGMPDNERCVAAFYDVEPPEEAEYPLVCLRFVPRSVRFARPCTHRDVLGTLMSLGLEREQFGDIILRENEIYLFCLDKTAKLVLDGMTQIGGTDVTGSISDAPDGPARKTQEIIVQVSSPRADAVIAHLFHLSRDDTQALFPRGLVLLDDAPCTKCEKLLTEGTVISVRGHGRARYKGTRSVSKKGKLNVAIDLYT